jgi:hypothetical protein
VARAIRGESVEAVVFVPTLVLTKAVLDAGTEPLLAFVK